MFFISLHWRTNNFGAWHTPTWSNLSRVLHLLSGRSIQTKRQITSVCVRVLATQVRRAYAFEENQINTDLVQALG